MTYNVIIADASGRRYYLDASPECIAKLVSAGWKVLWRAE